MKRLDKICEILSWPFLITVGAVVGIMSAIMLVIQNLQWDWKHRKRSNYQGEGTVNKCKNCACFDITEGRDTCAWYDEPANIQDDFDVGNWDWVAEACKFYESKE